MKTLFLLFQMQRSSSSHLLGCALGVFLGLPFHSGAAADLECYPVPALSSIPRMPDKLSSDARAGDTLRLTAAQGEYEPASFVIHPLRDIDKLELKATPLNGPGGSIPAGEVDLKIVKAWYQAGTAWYSYFADTQRRELTPELLLNDDALVRVDHEKKENYLRVGNEYRWVSYPPSEAKEPFNYFTEPVADSRTLQPVNLEKGRNQQIWMTVRVPAETPEGIYRGEVQLSQNGRSLGAMKLLVRVLPFELPSPRTYYNLENEYLVTLYGTSVLESPERFDVSREAAEVQQKKIFENIRKHNVMNPLNGVDIHPGKPGMEEHLKREIELMKEAGLSIKPFLSRGWSYPRPEEKDAPEKTRERIDAINKVLREMVDHDEIYVTSWDEAGPDRVRIMRDVQEYAATHDLKLWVTTAKGRHFEMAGYLIDYANHGGWPTREQSSQWHAIGSKVASYAGPHTGPENPDVFRRWEGLARYKANYDGSFNYIYYGGLHPTLWKKQRPNVWNDFMGGTFRQFSLVYPTADGVVDTIAWEGFREGIDDVRYATKLKLEADRAMKEGDAKARMVAKKALMQLELVDARTADLNNVRQEMIASILSIREAMAK